MLARISSRELTEWAVYERMNGPLGLDRADFHAAMISQTIASVNTEKGKTPPKISDFMPRWDQMYKAEDGEPYGDD